jgi:hypothetical protein
LGKEIQFVINTENNRVIQQIALLFVRVKKGEAGLVMSDGG